MTQQEMAGKIMIEAIGPGCSNCRDLYRRVGKVVAERGMDARVAHVTDLKTILRYIPFTPVLKVDGRIVHRGKRLPKKDKPGRFAAAEGGTIFLDEIGDASPALQVKLLRVLEDQTFVPLGGVAPITVDVRVIAASNKDVSALVQKGDFREDLFYRLNIIKIDLLSLCERREDIPLLVENCLSRFNAHKGKQLSGVSADVLARLMNYPFPGNIREPENILEHAYVLYRGTLIEEKHLPYDFLEKTNRDSGLPAVSDSPLAASERNLIRETLKAEGGNRVNTARQLGVSRTTLWRKIRKHGIRRGIRDGLFITRVSVILKHHEKEMPWTRPIPSQEGETCMRTGK